MKNEPPTPEEAAAAAAAQAERRKATWSLGAVWKSAVAILALAAAPSSGRSSSLPAEDAAERDARRRAGRAPSGGWSIQRCRNERAERANANRRKRRSA